MKRKSLSPSYHHIHKEVPKETLSRLDDKFTILTTLIYTIAISAPSSLPLALELDRWRRWRNTLLRLFRRTTYHFYLYNLLLDIARIVFHHFIWNVVPTAIRLQRHPARDPFAWIIEVEPLQVFTAVHNLCFFRLSYDAFFWVQKLTTNYSYIIPIEGDGSARLLITLVVVHRLHDHYFLNLTTLAGLPATTLYGGHDFVTTAEAPITHPRPTITPGSIVTLEPIQTSSSITTGLSLDQPCWSIGISILLKSWFWV